MSSSSVSRHHAYSRKQKSLGLLCSNFLKLYNRDDVESVGLDEAASRLGVERRRIYDIVNVLESVGVLARKAKNRYSWKGFGGIPQALEELKEEAIRENNGSTSINLSSDAKVFDDDEEEKSPNRSCERREEKISPSSSINNLSSSCSLSAKIKTDNRREKSLGLLTQNFVKLFLTMNADTVSLDEAARLLLGDDSSQMRTKVRRLYDIANVLSSMNLIEKTHQTDTRKPAFRWLGIEGKPNAAAAFSTKSLYSDQPKKREFGTEITNIDFKRSKVISEVGEKHIRMQMKFEDPSAERNCIQMQEKQQSSKGYVFGPFRPVGLQETEKGKKRDQDWDSLAATFRPQYHNQALSELFAHYTEAWKSWYVEVSQGSSNHQTRKAIQLPS
ncbi:E2F transcription factor-like E2FE isoform X2 [Magnolia sinica]|uniref:E2F transcription factor-like E2FE isoform X2 n=1 Tax=Magnolia sinica TaxID=86752 RepID=UPI002659EB22|nr:E2F transcription factor-like E2FE isoform X2 [Magnolia sinica]